MHTCQIYTRVISGVDALEALKESTKERIFIVCDKFLEDSGALALVQKNLQEQNEIKLFSELVPDPTLESVAHGVALAAKFRPTVLIGLGGGAALDTAKGIKYFAEKGKLFSLKKFIAIPTTSGTGSEMTAFAVFTDTAKGIKEVIVDEAMYPTWAILDPHLTVTVPPIVTANTGFDVLTHALEAYVCRTATNFTDAVALKSIELVLKNLSTTYWQGGDLETRALMQEASNMAGIAFTLSGLGAAHSLAHQLGSHLHLAHGLACAIALPSVVRFNAKDKKVAMKYTRLVQMLGLAAGSATTEQGVETLLAFIWALGERINVPDRVSKVLPELKSEDYQKLLDSMSRAALEDRCLPGNPRTLSYEEAYSLLEGMY